MKHLTTNGGDEVIAYCWQGGEIEFGTGLPEGALPVAVHDDPKVLEDVIAVQARHGYDGTLLVPGLPEYDPATSDGDQVDILQAFNARVKAGMERAGGDG